MAVVANLAEAEKAGNSSEFDRSRETPAITVNLREVGKLGGSNEFDKDRESRQ